MNLTLLPDTLAICRLEPDTPIPDWATGTFVSLTRTTGELSVVCSQETVPEDVQAERGWRCLRVSGKLDFSMVGVIAGLTTALADVGISIFVVSSYDTDFVLLREADLEGAMGALAGTGHQVTR